MSAIHPAAPAGPASRSAVLPSPDVPSLPIYRLSVQQYHAMAEHGILTTNDRVELIHGWLVRKRTKNPPHTIATWLTQDALTRIQPGGWHVRSQEPITLTGSEPEPDCALVQGVCRDYLTRHPAPAETAIVVEVADSTLDSDRRVKKPLFAEARIPVYWIINLIDSQVEVYTDPTGPAALPDYATQQIFSPLDDVPVVIAGQQVGCIAVRDLLP